MRAIGGFGRDQILLVRDLVSLQGRATDTERLITVLRRQRGGLAIRGQANSLASWHLLMRVVEGLAVLGEGEQAAALYPVVLEALKLGAVSSWWAFPLIQRIAGIAAAAGGQWENAEEHYETALRQAHEIPHRLEQPEVRRWYAQMLLERDAPGDREKARRILEEAVAMFRELGMAKHLEMAETALAQA